ncbi:MAG: bacillithiol biosynthesis cysteine-adding enzyme BshC [Candidatus Methylomirabilales bacterium]
MHGFRFDTIDAASLPRVHPIFRDYLKGTPALREFYRWDPREPQEKLLHCLARRSYPRDQLATILRDQNRAWGASESLLESIARLRDPRAITVITGQQVGLFGGPLYTLYKALTAVTVARQVESQWQIPCLPLFSMASEDTDFAEIDHLAMPDHQDQAALIRYAPDQGFGTDLPVTHTLTPKIKQAVAALEQAAGPGRLQERVLTLLRDCYQPGATLVSAFGRLLSALLGERGLIVVDPSDPRLKALARPLFLREVGTAPTSAGQVQSAWDKLRGLGYPPRVRLRGEGPNLFYVHEGRWPLKKAGDRGQLVAGAKRWRDGQELQHLVEETPERFSPNVVLRPLVHSFLFPTLVQVGGPHEIAYFAQLRGVFDHFDIPMPFLLPRASLTIVEGRIERLLKKHDLTFLALQEDPERVVTQVLHRSLPRSFVGKQQRIRRTILKNFAELKMLVSSLDSTLTPRVGGVEGVVKKQMDEMERLLLRSFKRRNQEVRTQVLRVLAHLMPGGELQERAYGFIPYLCHHGLPLTDLIAAAVDGPGWEHRVLYVAASRTTDDQ